MPVKMLQRSVAPLSHHEALVAQTFEWKGEEGGTNSSTTRSVVNWYWLVSIPGTQTFISLLLKQPSNEAAIDSFASDW